MEIDFGIGVLRKPIEYSVNLVEKQGSWTQIYGNSDGSYTPDRTVPSNYLIVAPEVVITNPNKAQGSQVSKGEVKSVRLVLSDPADGQGKDSYLSIGRAFRYQ